MARQERGIEPHIPVFGKSARTDGSLSRADFTYDHVGDTHTCPAGKLMTTRGIVVNDDTALMCWAATFDCTRCMRTSCWPAGAA